MLMRMAKSVPPWMRGSLHTTLCSVVLHTAVPAVLSLKQLAHERGTWTSTATFTAWRSGGMSACTLAVATVFCRACFVDKRVRAERQRLDEKGAVVHQHRLAARRRCDQDALLGEPVGLCAAVEVAVVDGDGRAAAAAPDRAVGEEHGHLGLRTTPCLLSFTPPSTTTTPFCFHAPHT